MTYQLTPEKKVALIKSFNNELLIINERMCAYSKNNKMELRDHSEKRFEPEKAKEIDKVNIEIIPAVLKERAKTIRKVIQKIKDDTYGICRKCGEAIPESRLKARPDADTCVPCGEEEERYAKRHKKR